MSSDRTTPTLSQGFQRARLQVELAAAVLISQWLWGIAIPYFKWDRTHQQYLPDAVAVVVAHGMYRVCSEWYQSAPLARSRRASKIDFGIALALGAGAIGTHLWFRGWLHFKFREVAAAIILAALGIIWGFALDGLATLRFVRSREEARRLALPRVPAVTMANVTFALVGTIIILGVARATAVLLSDRAGGIWFAFVAIPAAVVAVTGLLVMFRLPREAYMPAVNQHERDYGRRDWLKMRTPETGEVDPPLVVAAYLGESEAVREMLLAGADPNATNGIGWTPLILAAAEQKEAAVALLLEFGANPNSQNNLGRTALMFASKYGYVSIVRALLAAGADPNMEDYELGPGALASAAEGGHLEVVRLLLEAGAETERRDGHGRRALDCAERAGHGLVAAELRHAIRTKSDTEG